MGLQNDFWLCWYPLFDCKQRAYKKVSKYKMGVTIKWKKVPAYKVWASAPKLSIKSYPKRHSFSHKACHSVVEIGTPMLFLHSTFWLRHEMCFAPQRRALFEHLNYQKCSEPASFYHFWLWNVLGTTTPGTFSSSQLPKVVRNWSFFYILISTCASRDNALHFFHHVNFQKCAETNSFYHFWLRNVLCTTTPCTFSLSQLPKVLQTCSVFTTFDFEMYVAPELRALFQRVNFQKWCGTESFYAFSTCWLRHVLRATAPCTFSLSQLPKVFRTCGVFTAFDFEMCFAPQLRALFQRVNSQKWSWTKVFSTFWLRNVLRATTLRAFWASQLSKVVRTH